MKIISYLSAEELGKIPYCVKYFFEGEFGFFDQNNLRRYSRDFDLNTCLKANDVFENSTPLDFRYLCNYIGSRRQAILNEIEKLENKIRSEKKTLEELYLVGQTIDPNKNFKENIELIINLPPHEND